MVVRESGLCVARTSTYAMKPHEWGTRRMGEFLMYGPFAPGLLYVGVFAAEVG